MHEYEPEESFDLARWLGISGGRATLHGRRIVYQDQNGMELVLTQWPRGAFRPFCERYKRVVEDGWNNKLWLIPSGPWAGAVPWAPGRLLIPGIRCRLRIELDTSNEHVHCDVAYLESTSETHRTSSAPTVGQHWLARRACLDDYTSLGRLKADNLDLTPKPVWGQLAALHEIGHYLGLDHVNGSGNDEANYGVTDYQKASLMGHGTEIRPAHAWPWKSRLLYHCISARHVRWRGVTARPQPQLVPTYSAPARQSPDSEQHGTPHPDGGIAAASGWRFPGPTGRLT